MKNLLSKFVLISFLFLSTNVFAQLTEQERQSLAFSVRNDYIVYGIDGTRIYKTDKNYVLVAAEAMQSTLKSSEQSRVASMKARRDMTEFLKGAKTKSVSIFDSDSDESDSFAKFQSDDAMMEGQMVGSVVSSSVKENTRSFTEESLDEKIVQKAVSKIDGVESLMKFVGNEGETVYCYYIILSRSKAKKKH